MAVDSRTFVLLAAAGFVIRLLLCPFTTASTDLQLYGDTANDAIYGVPLYQSYAFSYPVLWGYFFRLAGIVSHAFGATIARDFPALAPYSYPGLYTSIATTPVANFFLKAPGIAADAFAALFLYLVLRKYARMSESACRTAVLVWWLNPLVIWVSAIQAGWDSFVGGAILAALYFAFERRWTTCGAIIALGALAKVVPILVVLPIAVWAYHDLPDWRARGSAAARGAFGFAIIVAALMVPVAAWHEVDALRTAVFARGSEFFIEGINLASIIWIKPLHWLFLAANDARGPLVQVTSKLQLAGFAVYGVRGLFAKKFDRDNALLMTLAIFLTVFVFSPYVQPNYVIWILPLLAIMGERLDRRYRAYTVALSVLAVVYIASVRAIQAIVLPACLFLKVCDPVSFAAAAYKYNVQTPGLFSLSPQVDINAVLGEVGAIIIVILAVFVVRRFWIDCGAWSWFTDRASGVSMRPRFSGSLIVILAGTLLLAALQFVRFSPPFADASRTSNGLIGVAIQHYRGDANIITSSAAAPPIRDVYLFDDSHFVRGRGGSATFAWAFGLHFTDQLKKHAVPVAFHVADAPALTRLLESDPRGKALLVLEGFLPATARTRHRNLLKNWIQAGGLVVWAGAPFDAFYSTPAQGARPAHLLKPNFDAWRDLYYGRHAVFSRVRDVWTPVPIVAGDMSGWWNIDRFDNDRATFPVFLDGLAKHGGTPLGFVSSAGYSSVSQLPIGKGRLVFFGDAFANEAQAAYNIAQLLYTGAWFEPRGIQATTIDVSPHHQRFTIVRPGVRTWRAYVVPPDFQAIAARSRASSGTGNRESSILQSDWPPAAELNDDALNVSWIANLHANPLGAPAFSDGRLVFTTGANRIEILDARTGALDWDFESGNAMWNSPLIDSGTLVFGQGNLQRTNVDRRSILGSGESALFGMDLATGTVRWYAPTTGNANGRGVVDGNALYQYDGAGYLNRVDLRAGTDRRIALISGLNAGAPLLTAGSRSLIGLSAYPNTVFAYAPNSSRMEWRRPLAGSAQPELVWADAGEVLLIQNGSLFALRSSDGSKLWSVADGDGAIPVSDGRFVYLGDVNANRLEALSARDGAVKWRTSLRSACGSSLSLNRGDVVAADRNGNVYRIDARTGRVIEQKTLKANFGTVPPIVVGTTVFLTQEDGTVWASPLP